MFPTSLTHPVQQWNTKATYTLCRADEIAPSEEVVQEIVAICNQPDVYTMLFREKRKGKPYTVEDAKQFLAWAKKGWQEHTYFVFFVLDPNGSIAAACDIKSVQDVDAEIGYWASKHHKGVMTNAVTAMVQFAKEAGWKSLVAFVRPENTKSQGVVERVGFLLQQKSHPAHPQHLWYRIHLT